MKKITVMTAVFGMSLMLVLGGCGGAAAGTPEAGETAAGNGGAPGLGDKGDGNAAAAHTDAADVPAVEKPGDGTAVDTAGGMPEGKAAADGTDKAAGDSAAADTAGSAKEKDAGGQPGEAPKDADAAAGKEDADGNGAKEGKTGLRPEDYEVTVFSEAEVMYASNPVNVRKGPATDFDRVGGLGRGQEVSVTGRADTGWYEIVYGGEKAYVSGHYLQKEKPEEQPAPQPQTGADGRAVTEVKNVAGVIMVGDSRFVQMQENIGANSCTWIAENGKGYNWLNENAVARIDGCVGKGSKILINLGVNDPEYVNSYIALVNAKAAEWVGKGAKVYYASVNPVWDNPYTTEEEVESFNSQMQAGLSGDVHWIDSHSYLTSIGYKLVDGLHFNAETYQNIYAYFMGCL